MLRVSSIEMEGLIAKKIALQKSFKDYNDENGFSYETWISPPVDHFYSKYKSGLHEIDIEMAPPLTYQT